MRNLPQLKLTLPLDPFHSLLCLLLLKHAYRYPNQVEMVGVEKEPGAFELWTAALKSISCLRNFDIVAQKSALVR